MNWISPLYQWFQIFLCSSWAPDLHIQLLVWHPPKTCVSNWARSFPKLIPPMFHGPYCNDSHTNARSLSSPRLPLQSPWSLSTVGFPFPLQYLPFMIKPVLHEVRGRYYCQCSPVSSPSTILSLQQMLIDCMKWITCSNCLLNISLARQTPVWNPALLAG